MLQCHKNMYVFKKAIVVHFLHKKKVRRKKQIIQQQCMIELRDNFILRSCKLNRNNSKFISYNLIYWNRINHYHSLFSFCFHTKKGTLYWACFICGNGWPFLKFSIYLKNVARFSFKPIYIGENKIKNCRYAA